jgi:ABC-2 type transport system ATP-binding protein
VIRASAVSFRFPSGRLGLDAVDFSADDGEVVAIVGPNGSGKTTLLRLLARLVRATAGEIEGPLDGAPSRIGWAPDTAVHFDELSAFANARFFARSHGADDSAVRPLLRDFGLDADADRPVAHFSFGMRRKLMLIEAMAHSPELLLLDEPTVGLDPAAILSLAELLHRHAAGGRTAVLATNDLAAARTADRVVFLHRGRKIADGTPSELLASVAGTTRIDFVLDQPAATLPVLDGVAFGRTAAGLVAETTGSALLPHICQIVADTGAHVREIFIREPDLRDVFRALAGEDLTSGAAESATPAAPSPPRARRRGPPWRGRTT